MDTDLYTYGELRAAVKTAKEITCNLPDGSVVRVYKNSVLYQISEHPADLEMPTIAILWADGSVSL